MQAIATAAVPPEWYVVSTLLGLWIGFIGAPWLASRTQGTRNFVRDLGVRFRLIDLRRHRHRHRRARSSSALMYAPFQHDIHNFNAPSQQADRRRRTAAASSSSPSPPSLLAPAMEELFFRGLLLKALVRLFTPLRAAGGARAAGVVLAVIVDGLLFGLAHGEWVQLAGLAAFGIDAGRRLVPHGPPGHEHGRPRHVQPGRHRRHRHQRERRRPLSPLGGARPAVASGRARRRAAAPYGGAREPHGPGLQGVRRARHGARPARRGHVPRHRPGHGPLRRRPRDPGGPRHARSRASSCRRAFSDGVRAEGVDVTDLGMASTDFLYFASGHLDAPGRHVHRVAQPGAVQRDQALPVRGAARSGATPGLADIEAEAEKLLGRAAAAADAARRRELDLLDEWADHVVSFVDVASLRPLKVVADTANGMGGLVVPIVFERLPFSVEILFPELDGTFPNHPADPIQPENLVDLKQAVLEQGADIGLAFDGDADRVFLVDERAEPVSGSLTTALVAASMLTKHPGETILYNLICSHVVPEVVTEMGGTAVRTRVGHSIIKQVMAETGAVFGGEHSGHYYYRDNFRADSGIITALLVLELLSQSGQPLSEMLAAVPALRRLGRDQHRGRRARRPRWPPSPTHERAAGASVDLLDGLTVEHGDWWYNVRPSNTEPLLRLNVEARTAERCAAHVAEVQELIAANAGRRPMPART